MKQFRSRNFEYQKVHRNPKHSVLKNSTIFFCDYEGDFNKFQIEQLLLLTFVEKTHFKYANVKKKPIVLKVKMQDNLLDFYVSNYYEKYSKEEESHKIGLKNAKMKLDLLYPKKYELNISDENNQYIVHLKLNF